MSLPCCCCLCSKWGGIRTTGDTWASTSGRCRQRGARKCRAEFSLKTSTSRPNHGGSGSDMAGFLPLVKVSRSYDSSVRSYKSRCSAANAALFEPRFQAIGRPESRNEHRHANQRVHIEGACTNYSEEKRFRIVSCRKNG